MQEFVPMYYHKHTHSSFCVCDFFFQYEVKKILITHLKAFSSVKSENPKVHKHIVESKKKSKVVI